MAYHLVSSAHHATFYFFLCSIRYKHCTNVLQQNSLFMISSHLTIGAESQICLSNDAKFVSFYVIVKEKEYFLFRNVSYTK